VTTVVASTALCPPGEPSPGWVAIDDGVITEVHAGAPPRGALDVGDALLVPAFVDLQCNGVGDVDFATADADGWHRALAALARHGVGALCATFVSAPLAAYDGMLAAAASARTGPAGGHAAVLGVHLEGPFLGTALGAHDPAHVVDVDVSWLERVLAEWPELVRMVTLAPEADPGFAGTRALAGAGIVVALGHSAASCEDAGRAAHAGASVVTHVFNGMPRFHHRSPGLVGAALTDERLTPTVIADLVHVHPAALRLAVAAKPDLAAVSDSVGAGAAGAAVRDGAAWLPDGTLAGATTLLDAALANLLDAGIPVARAVAMVTAAPARLVGADDRGVLRPGARGDVVAFDRRSGDVVGVWLGGVPVAS
jgi:N-acetylglucosamine-6-phosphate deacetylase